MKKFFLFFALMLTICSTAMAQDLTMESAVGTIGTLNGREAMVVDLGGTIGKVAVATRNVGATDANANGTLFTIAEANDPSKTGLTDGWYIPSDVEMDALMDLNHLSLANDGEERAIWNVTQTSALSIPLVSSNASGYGTKCTKDEQVSWTCYKLFINGETLSIENAYSTEVDTETTFLIRPFHKLPTIENRRIYYTTIDGKIIQLYNKAHPFPSPSSIAQPYFEHEIDEMTGKWCFTLSVDVTEIGASTFYECSRLSSIILPSTLHFVNYKAFGKCSNLLYIIFNGTTPPDVGGEALEGIGTEYVGGTVILVPSGSVNAYKKVGFTNVYDGPTEALKNKLLGEIASGMERIENSGDISTAINVCKDDINSESDVITIMNLYETAMLTIKLQKAKEDALTKIDKLVEETKSFDFDVIKEYSTLLEACRNNILNASGIDEVEAEMAKVMADVTIYRLVAKKDLETYLSTNHIHNFPTAEYFTRIDEATSEEAINAIVSEAQKKSEEIDKVRIGDDWYVLKKYQEQHLGYGEFTYYYTLENCPMTFTDAAEYVSNFEFTADEVHYSRDLTPVEGVWQCWFEPFDVTVDNTKFDAAEIEGLLVNADGETIVAFRKLADGATMHANKVYVIRAKAGEGKLELTLRDVMVYKAVQQVIWAKEIVNNQSELILQTAHEYFSFHGHYDYNVPKAISKSAEYFSYVSSSVKFYTLNDKGQFSIRNSSDKIKPQRFWMVVYDKDKVYYPAEQHAAAKEFIDMMVLGDEEEVTGITSYENENFKAVTEGEGAIYNLNGEKVTSIQSGQIYIMNGKKCIAK